MKAGRLVLIVVGIAFHLTYLWSIFDIYFVSPLVHGMGQYKSIAKPPAKRLFLIVGDGLRADTTFAKIAYNSTEEPRFLAPYLRSIVLNNGTYGVSHTRMPTESRPGHVAMIAGFYEDVSAVTKGWKENPVDFDSVLNQSSHTYSFGSPDILPMFAQGASDSNRIDTWMYGHEFEDFTKSSIELDAFVFKHLDELFYNSTINETLNQEIRQDQVIFFLHLLGCDTAGHSYRPYSKEYYDNVEYIDKKVSELVPKVEEFFGDKETAFIFTADHGMSALGSHGDGHPNNTRTPLIAFGKGVNKPIIDYNLPKFVEVEESTGISDTADWDLDHVKRNDVKQADIASLMSYLVGINYASNSVGKLPLDYIDTDNLTKLKALYNNALGFVEQYLVKEFEVSNSQFNFKHFKHFQEKPIKKYQQEIEELIEKIANTEDENSSLDFELQGIKIAEELMTMSLEGLTYLQTYNWQLLRSVVTLGFLGWILYSFMVFLNLYVLHYSENSDHGDIKSSYSALILFYAAGTGLNTLFYIQKSPVMYYIYGSFPVFFWQQLFSKRRILVDGVQHFFANTSIVKRGLYFVSIVGIFECITYGFFNRKIFSLLFVVLSIYPFAIGGSSFLQSLSFAINCLYMTGFTWSDAIKTESLLEINAAAVLLIIVCVVGFYKINKMNLGTKNELHSYTKSLLGGQILLIIGSFIATNISIRSLQARTGLPLFSQVLGWLVVVISLFFMPLLHSYKPNKDLKLRLLIIFLTFAPLFLILTISFELLFYVGYSVLILQWIEIETNYKKNNELSLAKKDKASNGENWLQILRISVIGFFLAQIAFFGTGNIASISSFSLESVYRLIPVFDPFSMGALLMIKLIVPYVLLSAGLGILNVCLDIKTFTISTLIISISDLLSLNFFFLVKTEGSWLDIGMTISNYCIAILASLFIILLEFFSQIVLKGVEINGWDNDPKEAKQQNPKN
ncbi:mannose-ethanolamine phosphotransferase [Saccharomycopsis crataegensis]|uniref:GPI ethanolamine phosphate transferase 1 n=1 Tax=Saccharomycopsis crataegensis TaxID=43959 RepID=A0AAV5QHK0_9ASCO|nr:mannose-ethanolamine phosphotransferase [Saccharomycopsis crataegensis]